MLLEGYSNFDKFERERGDNTLSPKRRTTVVEKRKRKEEEEEKEKREIFLHSFHYHLSRWTQASVCKEK